MNNQTPKYSFISARMAHNIAVWAMALGLKSEHADAFSNKVVKAIAKEIEAKATTDLAVTKRDGSLSHKSVKEHEVRQRATGKILKLTNGEKHEWFIELCSPAVKALVRQDQALFGLEAHGAGAYLAPVPGSAVEEYLLNHLSEFKASRPADYRAKSPETAKAEENALSGQ